MRRWIAVCAVVLAMGPCLKAQTAATAEPDAAKVAKVQEMFEVMHMDRLLSQIMGNLNGMIERMVQTMPGADQMTDQQKVLVQDFTQKAMKLSEDTLSWKSLEPEYVNIYASKFTTEEIDAITAFYKTPAGQSMLSKTPELTQATMKVVQGRMVDMQPKLRALQEDFMAKMKATQTGKPNGAATN